MNSTLIKLISIANLIMIIDITDTWDDLVLFFFVGKIPHLNITLTPDQVIQMNIYIGALIIFLIVSRPLIKFIRSKNS